MAEKPRPTFLQLVLGQLKGFVVILLIVAVMDEARKAEILAANDAMTKNDLRVLGLALRVLREDRSDQLMRNLSNPTFFVFIY